MADPNKPDRQSWFGKFFNSSPARSIGLIADVTAVVALLFVQRVAIVLIVCALAVLIGGMIIVASRRSPRPWGVFIGFVVASIGAGVGGYAVPGEAPTTSCEKSQGTIARPRVGEHVPSSMARNFVAEGAMTDSLCGAEALWPFVLLNNGVNPTYFQQEGPCIIKDRKFRCGTIGAVSPVGTSVDILIYRVDSDRLRQLVDKETAAQRQAGQPASKVNLRASVNPPVNGEPFASVTIVIGS